MSLFYPLTLAISLKYGFRSKAHKFASFVAILSIIGIAIGVAALIVDTSIMQGLQNRLKKAVLKARGSGRRRSSRSRPRPPAARS